MQTNVEHTLPRSQPESQGVASSAIQHFVEALDRQMHEIHSVMLMRHGHVIAEGWWSPYRAEDPHLLFSVSKSFTSTAVGLAVAEGRFAITDRVLPFFPDERPVEVSDFLACMTVEHLLTMTTGHADDTWPLMIDRADGDWIRAFLQAPVIYAPGTHFFYNTGASHILAAIVQKTTGLKLIDYLRPRLFAPLGIQTATWQESPQGIAVGGYGLSLTTESLARFGQLYLQKGRWDGQQIIPEVWVEAATAAQFPENNRAGAGDWSQGYGYQFWRCRHGGYQASGVFGQCCIVLPEQDAVLVLTSGIDVLESQQLLDIVWQMLLPAFAPEPLAADVATQATLAAKLASLTLAPVHLPAISTRQLPSAGQPYAMDANELHIDSITFDFNATGATLTFGTSRGEQRLNCGYGQWQPSRVNFFNEVWLSDAPVSVVSSGGWVSNDCFSLVVRLIETPFFYRLACHFIGDEVLVEMRINVTLDIPRTLLLTAHLPLAIASNIA